MDNQDDTNEVWVYLHEVVVVIVVVIVVVVIIVVIVVIVVFARSAGYPEMAKDGMMKSMTTTAKQPR